MRCIPFFLFIFVASAGIGANAKSSDCGPVTEVTFRSPSGTKIAHLVNQTCAYGFGAGFSVFWVVIGNEVVTVGREDRVDQLAQEGAVAFKTLTFEPRVSWVDDNSLIIAIEEVSLIQKSLHSLDNVKIKYRISEKLSKDAYLSRLKSSEPPELFKSHLKEYEVFEKWVKENVD
jgi:hypothetical protein